MIKKIFIFMSLSLCVGLLTHSLPLSAKKKKQPAKVFQVINQDLEAYTIYFGCVGDNSLKLEVGPGETKELEGNEESCQVMVRPSAAIHTKLFQKSCETSATLTITNRRVSLTGCEPVLQEPQKEKK
jgi:hypothetical protein